MRSAHQVVQAINKSTYRLDMSGVVGMLGGENAGDALETIHLHTGRKWVGWYNYPGSITVAKRFGQMAGSRIWDSLFPGPNESPAITFRLAGKSGPEYNGPYSGTELPTGYLGHLLAKACSNHPSEELQLVKKNGRPARKTGSSATVTVLVLPPRQHERVLRSRTMTPIRPAEKPERIRIHPKSDFYLALWSIVPSLISMAACILCLLSEDPLCAALILLGIVSSGVSSLILGAATLWIRVPVPSAGSPPGDGVSFPADGSIIVLKGEEADVNIITKGEFELDYTTGILPHQDHHTIGVSSLLLMTQFLVQLLLIPRCSFWGQILFLVSFVASGMYHLYVVSHEREGIHQELLFREILVQMEKRTLGTRTQMAIFVCLLLGNGRPNPSESKPNDILGRIIPNLNKTSVWRYWKKKVLRELDNFWKCDIHSSHLYVPAIQAQPEDQTEQDEYDTFTVKDSQLLEDLIDDAWCVFHKYPRWRDGETRIWREGDEWNEEKARLLLNDSAA